jgi:hypothetical protein
MTSLRPASEVTSTTMQAVEATFTAPDGSRITLRGRPTGDAWSCPFVARVYGNRRAFAVASTGAADTYARRRGFGTLSTHRYGDTELLLGFDDKAEESMVAWRGPWHELLLHQSGPRASLESFTRVLDAFRLTDLVDGLLVTARSERQFTIEPFPVYIDIAGYGSLRIQRPHETDAPPPAWRGFTTPHGEIWKQPLSAEAQTGRARTETLVLATPTAVAELFPGMDDTADSSAAVEFLAGLDVSWTAG